MNEFIRTERQSLVTDAVLSLREAKYSGGRKFPTDVAAALVDLEKILARIRSRPQAWLTAEEIGPPLDVAHRYLECLILR